MATATFVAVVVVGLARFSSQVHRIKSRVAGAQQPQLVSRTAIAIAATTACLSVVLVLNAKLVLLLVPIGAISAIGVRKYKVRAGVVAYEAALPPTLEAIARGMRSGAGILQALREASHDVPGPVAADMARLVTEIDRGLSMTDALARWHRRSPLPAVRIATSSLALAIDTGAAHAEVIDRVSVSVRQELNAKASAGSHATQARASAVALTCLPVLFTGPLVIADQQVRHFLLGTWLGLIVLVTGLLLDGLGAWWMARLVRGVTE